MPIIHGDACCFTISAASIIAKVERDKIMERLSKNEQYRKFNWNKNKGYGTKDHQEVLLSFGMTNLHRRIYLRKLFS